MRLLLQALYRNILNDVTTQWADLVCELVWYTDFESLPREKQMSIFHQLDTDFTCFIEAEFQQLKYTDETFLNRWNMLKKSDFNSKLWSQFSDIAEMTKALLVEYLNKCLENQHTI
jgi:hypothetical protein